jgi:TolB-like protein
MLLGKATDDYGVCLGFADALVARLGNLTGVDVLPTSAVLSVPAGMTPAEAASRLGVRFAVHGGIQMSKGLWRLSLEMFDTHLQTVCFTRKRDLDLNRLSDLEDEIAKQIAMALNRPLGPTIVQRSPRYSKDPMAYAEFMRGYKLSSSGNPAMLDEAARHLGNAVARRSRPAPERCGRSRSFIFPGACRTFRGLRDSSL